MARAVNLFTCAPVTGLEGGAASGKPRCKPARPAPRFFMALGSPGSCLHPQAQLEHPRQASACRTRPPRLLAFCRNPPGTCCKVMMHGGVHQRLPRET